MSRMVKPEPLGDYRPLAEIGPTRTETGAREDGRGLSTIEQRQEALRWMVAQAERKGEPRYVEARIFWALQEPTKLQVEVAYETTPAGPKIGTVRAVLEFDEEGAQIVRTAREMVDQAKAEAPKLGRRGL